MRNFDANNMWCKETIWYQQIQKKKTSDPRKIIFDQVDISNLDCYAETLTMLSTVTHTMIQVYMMVLGTVNNVVFSPFYLRA